MNCRSGDAPVTNQAVWREALDYALKAGLTSPTATSPASVTAATTTVAATATAAVATSAAISSGARFINRQIAAVEVLAVELLNGCSRFFRGRHLDKAETSRATRHAVFYDLSRFNVTRLGKVLAQIIAARLEREISH